MGYAKGGRAVVVILADSVETFAVLFRYTKKIFKIYSTGGSFRCGRPISCCSSPDGKCCSDGVSYIKVHTAVYEWVDNTTCRVHNENNVVEELKNLGMMLKVGCMEFVCVTVNHQIDTVRKCQQKIHDYYQNEHFSYFLILRFTLPYGVFYTYDL